MTRHKDMDGTGMQRDPAPPFSMRQLGRNLSAPLRGTGPAWLAFLIGLLVFHHVLAKPFYASLEHLGHDFAASAPAMLEGRFWLQTNGWAGLLNPPWFTPAWCAGAAFFADPQASFYAPFQWLALVLDPFQATEASALVFAAVAYWGGYLLSRRVFGWLPAASMLFALLGMANAFMPMRSAVGEVAYQPLYLWVWLVLALCWRTRATANWRARILGPALGCALLLTAWLHFGFAGMMVPAFLGAMLLCLVLALAGRVPVAQLFARAIMGGIVAILLNGSKLYEAASLMRNFPRDFYGMPGFASLHDAMIAPLMALLLPSEWTAHFGERRLSNVQFGVLPHEWALEFGLGALAVTLMSVAMLLWLRRNDHPEPRDVPGSRAQKYGVGILVFLLCMLPPLLLWNQGAVRDLLKQIPILNSATWPMRWIVIYLPLMQWLLVWPIQAVLARLPTQRQEAWAVAAAVVIWLGPAMAPVGYYLHPGFQSYDPKPILQAHARSLQTGKPVPIDRVEASPERGLARNDTMLDGASQGFCYNPLYGYRLEAFPQIDRLRSESALSVDASGQSLIFNPACLIHPRENGCKPGDGFRMDDPVQRQAAKNFIARQPFEWRRPWAGQVLSWISQGLFWLILLLLVMPLGKRLFTAVLPHRPRNPDDPPPGR